MSQKFCFVFAEDWWDSLDYCDVLKKYIVDRTFSLSPEYIPTRKTSTQSTEGLSQSEE